MKTISDAQKDNIKSLVQQGKSIRCIAKTLNIGITTISRYQKALCPGFTPNNTGGRPKKVTKVEGRLITRKFKAGEFKNCADAKRQLEQQGVIVARQTVCNIIAETGLVAKIKKKTLPLNPTHEKLRMDFCHKYKD
ncbi:hypothetical protein DFQ29_003096 [Apophysomyces sp. BC1021]|nr:hypothetical protein DFQ29_003096 [Apophysomyces sp. BC1021]